MQALGKVCNCSKEIHVKYNILSMIHNDMLTRVPMGVSFFVTQQQNDAFDPIAENCRYSSNAGQTGQTRITFSSKATLYTADMVFEKQTSHPIQGWLPAPLLGIVVRNQSALRSQGVAGWKRPCCAAMSPSDGDVTTPSFCLSSSAESPGESRRTEVDWYHETVGGWGGGQRKVEMARGAIEVGEFWQMAVERTLLTATKEEEEEKSVGYSACQSRCFTLQSFTQSGASSVSLSVCYFVSSFVIPPTWQSVGLSSLSVTGSPWASLFPRCWIVFSTLDLSTSSSLSINNLVQSFSLTFIKSDSQPLSFLRQTDRRQCKEQTSPSSRCVLGSKTPKSQITNWQTETPDSK